jgi:hypothetical protein
MAYGGHCYYVRKCKTGDLQPDGTRTVGGIVLPEMEGNAGTNNSFWAEVMGIGPQSGRPCPDIHRHQFRRARCIGDLAVVGDLVMLPAEDQGIKRSPYADYEFFVEESVPLAIYKGGAA